MIRDSNYITVLAPMITKLKLKGNELLIFALIHGFSQDGETAFKGSISYLMKWTGLDKSTVIGLLKKLVDREYLEKHELEVRRVRRVEYRSNYYDLLGRLENPTTPPVGKSDNPRLEKATTPPVGKSDPILIDNNNIDKKNNDSPETTFPGTLFPDEPDDDKKPKEVKTLFRNSKFADLNLFLEQFKAPDYETIDMAYYYHAVSDWSDSSNTKRTPKGWLATARTFVRGDVQKNKVVYKAEHKPESKKINVAGAMDYLNEYD